MPSGPNPSAPISDTREPKNGMASDKIQPIRPVPKVHASHTSQWIGVSSVRCLLPFNNLTKRLLATVCTQIIAPAIMPGIATAYAMILMVSPAEPSAGEATHLPQ